MRLTANPPIAFIPTANAEAAHAFYEKTLGLTFVEDNGFAIVFSVGPQPALMLRIVRVESHQPAAYTIFGWQVDDLAQAVEALASQGLTFERYPWFAQDNQGIWQAPDGSAVAWFKDPDGNTLSVSQMAQQQPEERVSIPPAA